MEQVAAPAGRGSGPRRSRIAIAVVVIFALALVTAIVALHDTVARDIVVSAARSFGYDVSANTFDVGLSGAVVDGVRVTNAAGEPVLEARHIDVGYSLRDLLPGGKRLFGLTSVTIVAPHLTVIHHPNGSYNITLPPAQSSNAKPSNAQLDVRLHVAGGSVDVVDRFVAAPHERRVQLVDVAADGTISPAVASTYHGGAVYVADGKRYPLVAHGRFADARGFEFQQVTAARLPVAALANFALSTHAITVEAGELVDVDAQLGALATASGTMQMHLGASARLTDGRVAAATLAKPIRDARGSFVIDDDSATVRDLDASLNGLPLHLRGTIYHFAQPRIAFALTVRGDLARVRAISPDLEKVPIGGAIRVEGLAEGSAANPLLFARLSSPAVDYGVYRLDAPHGFVAISGQELDVLSAGVRYGRIGVTARGALQLARHTQTTGYALLHAPANAIPYVDNIVPGMALDGSAVARGSDGKLALRGMLEGAGGGSRLDGPFSVSHVGSGTVGPIVLQRSDGASVYARAVLDGPARQTVAVVDAHGLSLLPAPAVALPGVKLPLLPAALDAKLDASLAGVVNGTSLAAADGDLHAYGTWGDLRADAGGSAQRVAASGRLTSSFERLAPLTGPLGARGGIDIPFALTSTPGGTTVVQIAGARFPAARIRGIALDGADATVGIDPSARAIDIYSADVRAAGRTLTARGRLGAGGRVQLTAGNLDLAVLRAAGVPLANGRATVIADIGGTLNHPIGSLIAALGDARYANTPVGGDAGLAYDGSTLHVDRATLTYGGAYADARGSVSGLTPGKLSPRYDLRARLEDADIATLARTVKSPLRYPAGTIDADVRIGGAGARPSVTGNVQIPEGSINGLNFRAGRVEIAADAHRVAASGGRITVGNTTLDFGGSATVRRQSVVLRTHDLDLADFNDYFDEADVLAGIGSVALSVTADPTRLNATGDVRLNGSRYRRFALGDGNATLRTTGRTVRIHGGLRGAAGRFAIAGSANLPARDPLRDTVRRSFIDVNTQIAGIDLGTVLPAAGFDVPLLGLVDGTASIRGRYPALAVSAQASLTNGVAGRLPIQRFTVAASAVNGRGRLTDLTLAAPGLSASASGTFGLEPQSAFDLQARATSADIKTLVASATGKNPGITGTLDTRVALSGTLAKPQLTGSLDATDLTYMTVTVPRVHADLAANRAAVDVRNGEIGLPRSGSITFDAHAPLSTGPATPIALDFAPHGVDVKPYSSLLPDGSVVEGVFDGNVGVRGTLAAPSLRGNLAFERGSYRSNTLKLPLTAIALDLDFAGTTVKIAKLHAHAAPGNIDGSGSVTVGDLRDPLKALRTNITLTASNALVSAPKYYVGYVDGSATVTKRVRSPLLVGGNFTFSSARIPYTALLPSGGTATSAASALPDVAFNLGVSVGRDVRIQSGPVDIGTTGSATLGGTLAKPTLDGTFTATDGTVSVYRTFVIQNPSAVTFSPADGITPSVDATAVTQISDPATTVLLHVTGLSTHLNLAFSSQPAYTQEQILGLLVNAQAFGAVAGVAQTNGSTGGPSISGIGEGVLNQQFTQKFLQPFSSKLGGALGLSDLNLNYNTNGAVSAVARRTIGKNISFSYGEQIGGPTPLTSFGINIGTSISGAQLTFYQAAYSQQAFGGQALTPYLQSGFLATSPPNYTLQAIAPPNGSGFVFSYVRHFW